MLAPSISRSRAFSLALLAFAGSSAAGPIPSLADNSSSLQVEAISTNNVTKTNFSLSLNLTAETKLNSTSSSSQNGALQMANLSDGSDIDTDADTRDGEPHSSHTSVPIMSAIQTTIANILGSFVQPSGGDSHSGSDDGGANMVLEVLQGPRLGGPVSLGQGSIALAGKGGSGIPEQTSSGIAQDLSLGQGIVQGIGFIPLDSPIESGDALSEILQS